MFPAAQFDPSTEDSIYIGAIDPTNPDTVYIRSSGLVTGGQSRLTVVTNASSAKPTFTTARIFDVEAGFAGRSDRRAPGTGALVRRLEGLRGHQGRRPLDGVDLGSRSSPRSRTSSCSASRRAGNELWACSAEVSGFIAGVSTDDGATFTPKLPLLGALTGPIACAANQGEAGVACHTAANSSQCGPAYQTFCGFYGCGIPEGGTGGRRPTGDAEGKPSGSSSTCNVSFVGLCRCGGGAMFAGAVAIAASPSGASEIAAAEGRWHPPAWMSVKSHSLRSRGVRRYDFLCHLDVPPPGATAACRHPSTASGPPAAVSPGRVSRA